MRFNPPPNWPKPPAGWQPPPDWHPDPSWGPAPEGWPLWIDTERQRPSSSRLIPVALVILIAIAAASIGLYEALKPHDIDVAFTINGNESYVDIDYGLKDAPIHETRIGSGGAWSTNKHIKIREGTGPRAVIFRLSPALDMGENSYSCQITADGKTIDSEGPAAGQELLCSGVVG